MIRRLKNKLARRFRAWADKLAPETKPAYMPFEYPILYAGKEYELVPLRLSIPYYTHLNNPDALSYAYKRATDQIAQAAAMHVSVDDNYPDDEVVLQLLILARK